jgi:2-polyprenyl-3-methyl-5-hydroxy-6-metoxy-1,4-benzoquinol methylase
MSCQHKFGESSVPDYAVCEDCGTYFSLAALPPTLIYDKDYWSEKWNHGTIHDQRYNVDCHLEEGVSKNDFTISNIRIDDRESVLEIACAPGSLLTRLREIGFKEVVGIEVDPNYENDIREWGHQGRLIFGYFPEITQDLREKDENYSLVIGLDILEHCFYGPEFIKECYRLLKSKGQLILMTPIISNQIEMTERFFHPIEHVYLYSEKYLTELLSEIGFTDITFDRWTIGHEMVSARKT